MSTMSTMSTTPLLTTMKNLLAALGTMDSPRMASTWGAVDTSGLGYRRAPATPAPSTGGASRSWGSVRLLSGAFG